MGKRVYQRVSIIISVVLRFCHLSHFFHNAEKERQNQTTRWGFLIATSRVLKYGLCIMPKAHEQYFAFMGSAIILRVLLISL